MTKILVVEGNKVISLDETRFTLEGKLQDYLEEYPSLIPLQDVEEGTSDLMCIGKEVSVPSGSIDLLFIDAGGVLTIVETKLAKNPEVRREVIGQIIEYASYISKWTVDKVYEVANAYLKSDLGELIERLSIEDFSPDDLRSNVDQNLRKGKIRLIVAVDELIEPLRSTVAFLNSYSSFDVFLLQLKSFEESDSKKVLIPSLFGYSKPTPPPPRPWDKDRFFKDLNDRCESDLVATVEKLHEFAKSNAGDIRWGTGARTGSFSFHKFNSERQRISIFTIYSDSSMYVNFGTMKDKVDKETIESFRAELNEIPGVGIPEEAITGVKWPSIKVKVLVEPSNLQRFEKAVSALCQAIDAGH